MKKQEKTNVMRILEQHGIDYRQHCYSESGAVGGAEVAATLGQDPARVFKTLVTVGHGGGHFVFVIPVCRELNLKKDARAVGEKSIEMLKSKELLPLTGYVHGGCSPIGMKKPLPTTVDRSAWEHETICFSAGKIGYQVELPVQALASVIALQAADLCD